MLSCWAAAVTGAGYGAGSDNGRLTGKPSYRNTRLWTKGRVKVSKIATWSFKENSSSAHTHLIHPEAGISNLARV